jgi:hypothetical protein
MFSSMPINGNFNVSSPQILGQPNSTAAIQMLMLQMMMSMATILASMMNQQGSVVSGGSPNFGGSSGAGSPGLNGFLGGSAQPGNTGSQSVANPQSATASSGQPSGNLVDLGGGKKVDASIAGNVKAMIEAAKRDGVDLKITSAHRSREQQEVLYQKYLKGTGNLAAKPGTSNHEGGLAIDFTNTPGAHAWLAKNAGRFGLKNLPGEPWHYSTTGR